MFTVIDFYNFPLCACSSLLSIFHCAGAFDTMCTAELYDPPGNREIHLQGKGVGCPMSMDVS